MRKCYENRVDETAASEEARRTLQYVESLNEARTLPVGGNDLLEHHRVIDHIPRLVFHQY